LQLVHELGARHKPRGQAVHPRTLRGWVANIWEIRCQWRQ